MDYVKKFLHVDGIVGQGAFGKVLVTSSLQNGSQESDAGTRFALKCVHPILKPQRLANELRHLRDLGGLFNVVQMHTAHLYMGSLYIVMEFIEHDKFVEFVAQLDYSEIVNYMKNLLDALNHVHTHHIMHRDIKPANFLYNRKYKKYLLVDFGLAQKGNNLIKATPTKKKPHIINQSPARHYIDLTPTKSPAINSSTKRHLPDFNQMLKKLRVSNTREPVKLTVGAYESPITNKDSGFKFSTPTIPSKSTPSVKCDCLGKPKTCTACLARPDSNAPKSGTPGFKAPEILLRYPNQTSAVDIWSAGVILIRLLSGHSPIFDDVSDDESLRQIIALLGFRKVDQAAEAMGIVLNIEPKIEPKFDLMQLCKIIRLKNKDTKRQLDIPDTAFDLLDRMLDPNPITRITASEAVEHAWFQPMAEV